MIAYPGSPSHPSGCTLLLPRQTQPQHLCLSTNAGIHTWAYLGTPALHISKWNLPLDCGSAIHPGHFPPYPSWPHFLETSWKLVHLLHWTVDGWMGYFHGRIGGIGVGMVRGSLCWTLNHSGARGCEYVQGPSGLQGSQRQGNLTRPQTLGGSGDKWQHVKAVRSGGFHRRKLSCRHKLRGECPGAPAQKRCHIGRKQIQLIPED